MNALELADLIECACCAYQKEAGAMLRQQANRIGVLEANHKIQLNINDKALKYIAELEKRNKELESFYRTVKALQE